MHEKHPIIKGTIILIVAGFLARILGFYNRIFLSRAIGAKEIGIYQMVFPVYLFCFSVCCQGFEVGLSQTIARQYALHKNGNIIFLFRLCASVCIFLSFIMSAGLFLLSDTISVQILHTPSASVSLKISAFAVPFVALKGCVHGYYIGKGNSSVPSFCQLCEQLIRIATTFLVFHTILYVKFSGAKLAALGMVSGEIFSSIIICFLLLKDIEKNIPAESEKGSLARDFFKISCPLSANRICLTLLQSIEAVCIPQRMLLYYGDHTLSLELYGILTGMVLPFLFFPSTITNSLATMLLPSIASDKERQDHSHINRTISYTTYGCFLMGILFTSIFFLFGPLFGTKIFHNVAAGQYLKILSFLCPALYLSTVFTSILNGLGKTQITFFHNMISILIRIGFILFAIPKFGIDGYIWSLLISTFLLVFSNYISIQKEI